MTFIVTLLTCNELKRVFNSHGFNWADSFMKVGLTSLIFNDIGLYGTKRLSNDSF